MRAVLSLKAFLHRDLTKAAPPPRDTACGKCGHANELPWAFCGECGAPRMKLGSLRVTSNLTMAMVAFLGTWWFAEIRLWPWMLYAFYAILFMQLTLIFASDQPRLSRRMGAWTFLFLVLWGWIWQTVHSDLGGMDFIVYSIQDLPEYAADQPLIFWPCAIAAVVLLFLPVFFRWKREYGWINAYRIALLSIAALFGGVLAAFRLAQWVHGTFPEAAEQRWLTNFATQIVPEHKRLASMLALGAVRLFVFEIFVFSAVRGYAVANKGREVLDKAALAKETGFVRALLVAGGIVRRFVSALEQMASYLAQTLKHIAVDMSKVLLAFLRELLAPAVTLTLVGVGLKQAADLTIGYVENGALATAGSLALLVAGSVVAECVLLMCKSRYRPARVLEIHVHMLGWLVPNVLVFFILISISLWASGAVLGGDDPDAVHLPFAVGPLTKGAIGLLAAVAFLVLYRKRHVFLKGGAAAAPTAEPAGDAPAADSGKAPEAAANPAPAAAEIPAGEEKQKVNPVLLPTPAKGRFRIGDRLNVDEKKKSLLRAAGAAREAVLSSDLGQKGKKALGGVQERLAGKPETVISFEEAKAKLDMVRTRMDALMRSKTSLSTQHFEEFRDRYGREEADLAGVLETLQRALDSEYAKQYWELEELEGGCTTAKSELEGLKSLAAAGAIDPKEFDARRRKLESQIEMTSGAVASRRKRLEFYLPWVRDVESADAADGAAPQASEEKSKAGSDPALV